MDTVQKRAEVGDVPAIITHIENLTGQGNYQEAAKWFYIAAIRLEGDCACWQAPDEVKEFVQKKIFRVWLLPLFFQVDSECHAIKEDEKNRKIAQYWFDTYCDEFPEPFWLKEYYLKILGLPLYISCTYKSFEPKSKWKQLREQAQKKYALRSDLG